MSQSNYNIPNQSAPAVRAQLNSVFGSIATNNSGSAAPSTTFAHQWWYDTTTNILKQRNAANSAWIDIGTFDQTGGTFTPSGQRDLASQAEAEAGTDNTKLVTPLRVAEALMAQIGQANASLVPGYVGSYVWGTALTNLSFGATLAGSSIRPAGTRNTTDIDLVSAGGTLSGTWRMMGGNSSGTVQLTTLWLRIS